MTRELEQQEDRYAETCERVDHFMQFNCKRITHSTFDCRRHTTQRSVGSAHREYHGGQFNRGEW